MPATVGPATWLASLLVCVAGWLIAHALGHYVLGFGQDPAGEIHVLTTDQTGPTRDDRKGVQARATKRLTQGAR